VGSFVEGFTLTVYIKRLREKLDGTVNIETIRGMIISKCEIGQLSADVRKTIDGKNSDFPDNREGVCSILKSDIYTLATLKNEQVDALGRERDMLKDTLADISHQIKASLLSMSLMTGLLENAPPEKQVEFIANIRSSLTHTAMTRFCAFENGEALD
jgi:signal transduction histidine kinase